MKNKDEKGGSIETLFLIPIVFVISGLCVCGGIFADSKAAADAAGIMAHKYTIIGAVAGAALFIFGSVFILKGFLNKKESNAEPGMRKLF